MATWRDEMQKYIRGAVARHLTEDSPQAEQPPWIQQALRPHQLTLLAAARRLESMASIASLQNGVNTLVTSYGVIADRVGAGKSLVALSLVRDPPVQQTQMKIKESGWARLISVGDIQDCDTWNDVWSDVSGVSLRDKMISRKHPHWYTTTSLMIVPHNTITQWESYVTEQTSLSVTFIKKTKDCDYSVDGWLRRILTSDVVIVSCTMLRKFIGGIGVNGPRFADIVWSRIFLDEADSIGCTLRSGEIHARFFWFITGSWLNMLFPSGIYMSTMQGLAPDIQALIGEGTIAGLGHRLNFVRHGVSDVRSEEFAGLILRNRDDWINKSLQRPVIIHETIMCKAPATFGILQEFISPAAMEALHAGDTTGALTAMGLKPADKSTVADRVTASLRGELIQAEKILAFKKEIEYSSVVSKTEAIKKAEARVERLKGQLVDLESRLAAAMGGAKEEGALCPICYDIPQCPTLTPCCRQPFCLACICTCIIHKPACPFCRTNINSPKDLLVVGEAEEDTGIAGGADDKPQLLTKGAALLKLLSESTEDQRFLVFSAHEASFGGLRDLLSAREIRCEMLNGTAARVDRLRTQFRDGTVRVLCMNARHVGAGINLEAATHVVLYHRMNVEMEKQVIGRAVRFERAEELRVVHLMHEKETAMNGAQVSEVVVHV